MGGIDVDDEPFDGEEMQNLEELCTLLNLPDHISTHKFLYAEDELELVNSQTDSEVPTWRDDARAMIIQKVLQNSSEPQTKQQNDMCEITDDDEDNEFDCDLPQPVITSIPEALKTAEQISRVCRIQCIEELSKAILNVTDFLKNHMVCDSLKNKH